MKFTLSGGNKLQKRAHRHGSHQSLLLDSVSFLRRCRTPLEKMLGRPKIADLPFDGTVDGPLHPLIEHQVKECEYPFSTLPPKAQRTEAEIKQAWIDAAEALGQAAETIMIQINDGVRRFAWEIPDEELLPGRMLFYSGHGNEFYSRHRGRRSGSYRLARRTREHWSNQEADVKTASGEPSEAETADSEALALTRRGSRGVRSDESTLAWLIRDIRREERECARARFQRESAHLTNEEVEHAQILRLARALAAERLAKIDALRSEHYYKVLHSEESGPSPQRSPPNYSPVSTSFNFRNEPSCSLASSVSASSSADEAPDVISSAGSRNRLLKRPSTRRSPCSSLRASLFLEDDEDAQLGTAELLPVRNPVAVELSNPAQN